MFTELFAGFPDCSMVVIKESDILLPSDIHMAQCYVKFSFLLYIGMFRIEKLIFLCGSNMKCKFARK